jgi:hypothetical protein
MTESIEDSFNNNLSIKSIAMKQIFIVLLIAAIGVGVYFYFAKKHSPSSQNAKELILGKWKADSAVIKVNKDSLTRVKQFTLNLLDSGSISKYEFDFRKDSLVLQAQNGKVEDSSHYEFAGDNNLLIWSVSDTARTKFTINRLDRSNLIIQDKDSARFFFKKLQ